MRRLRYICGGEEGRVASGSEGANGGDEVESPDSAFSSDGAGEDDLETTVGTDVPGGGAPLTIWSSLEPDIVSYPKRSPFYSVPVLAQAPPTT